LNGPEGAGQGKESHEAKETKRRGESRWRPEGKDYERPKERQEVPVLENLAAPITCARAACTLEV